MVGGDASVKRSQNANSLESPYPYGGTARPHTPMEALRAPIPPSHEEGLKFIQKTKTKSRGDPLFFVCVFPYASRERGAGTLASPQN